MIVVLIVALFGWILASVVLAPLIGAALAGRRMTPAEKDLLGWGGLAVAMALFLLAVLIIGAHK